MLNTMDSRANSRCLEMPKCTEATSHFHPFKLEILQKHTGLHVFKVHQASKQVPTYQSKPKADIHMSKSASNNEQQYLGRQRKF